MLVLPLTASCIELAFPPSPFPFFVNAFCELSTFRHKHKTGYFHSRVSNIQGRQKPIALLLRTLLYKESVQVACTDHKV